MWLRRGRVICVVKFDWDRSMWTLPELAGNAYPMRVGAEPRCVVVPVPGDGATQLPDGAGAAHGNGGMADQITEGTRTRGASRGGASSAVRRQLQVGIGESVPFMASLNKRTAVTVGEIAGIRLEEEGVEILYHWYTPDKIIIPDATHHGTVVGRPNPSSIASISLRQTGTLWLP